MGFKFDQERVVFEGTNFYVYDVHDLLPKHRNFPRGAYDVKKPNGKPAVVGSYKDVHNRDIAKFYFHQSAGNVTRSGLDGLMDEAHFFVRDPAWDDKGRWTGRGRGWPGFAYTYYLPYRPLVYNGKYIVFMCNKHETVSWHSGDNYHSEACVLQGYFYSRHIKTFKPKKGQDGHPSKDQMHTLLTFTDEYVIEHLGIDEKQVVGHYMSPHPKPTCPGDDVEYFLDGVQEGIIYSGTPDDVEEKVIQKVPGALKLDTWAERQAALVWLGHDLGNYGELGNGVDGDPGNLTRMAIETQEELMMLKVDGYWDDVFDFQIKMLLMALSCTQDDLEMLIP